MMINKNIIFSLLVVITFTLMTSCSKVEQIVSNEPKVLRVLGPERVIMQTSNLFEVNEETIEIEIIDTQKIIQELSDMLSRDSMIDINKLYNDKISEIINGPNSPDVLYLTQAELPNYIDDGLLVPLETFIDGDHFDLKGITPSVIEAIRNVGNGTIYALAPTFDTQVLYYNKDLFDKMNLPYPEDRMSWEKIFNLAHQLTYEENGIKYYGLAFPAHYNAYYQLELYLSTYNLSDYDGDYTNFVVNTRERERAWKTIIDLQHDGVVAPLFNTMEPEQPLSYFENDLFIGGRAAMTISGYSEIGSLEEMITGRGYFSEKFEHPDQFNWDIVTFPIHPELGDVGSRLQLRNLIGINTKSNQTDIAWKYIAFINGEKVAKAYATRSTELMSRFDFVRQPKGLSVNLEAFTKLKPAPYNTDVTEVSKKYSNSNWWELTSLEEQYFNQALRGEKTIDEALAEFQIKGQELLEQMIFQQNEEK